MIQTLIQYAIIPKIYCIVFTLEENLEKKMKIALIYGGKSGEHEISLVSAAAIARNIDSKNQIVLIEPQ